MSNESSKLITIDDKELRQLLKTTLERTGDLKPAFDLIGEYFLSKIDNQFRNETDPYDVPWKPLSPYTISLKRKEGKILKILQRTGYMRSTTYYTADSKRLRIGFRDPKALKHQSGKDVPQRELLGINKKDERVVKGTIQDYLALKRNR